MNNRVKKQSQARLRFKRAKEREGGNEFKCVNGQIKRFPPNTRDRGKKRVCKRRIRYIKIRKRQKKKKKRSTISCPRFFNLSPVLGIK